jgi:hypothetical protein
MGCDGAFGALHHIHCYPIAFGIDLYPFHQLRIDAQTRLFHLPVPCLPGHLKNHVGSFIDISEQREDHS